MSKTIEQRVLNPQEVDRLRRELHEVSKPFIEMLVDLYAVSLPRSVILEDGGFYSWYSLEVYEQDAKIRELMREAQESVSKAFNCHGLGAPVKDQ